MKITQTDINLAKRFPIETGIYGHGLSQSDAKCSNEQIQRLIKLGLIEQVSNRFCGGSLNQETIREITTYKRIKNKL